MKYKNLPEDWVIPYHRKFKMICCDCGLVHDVDFRVHKGNIQFLAKRNNRSTALTRRKLNYIIKEKIFEILQSSIIAGQISYEEVKELKKVFERK
jgi:hypothetical protein